MNNPNRYLSILGQFEGVISSDYSLYRDFPESMKIWNTYRNFASGCWLQSKGLNVIANVRLSGKQSSKYALSGAPHDSVIAIGAHGNIKNIENQDYFYIDVATIVNELHPRAIIVYGPDSKGIFEYPKALGIPLYFFENTRYLRFSRKAPSDQATK